MKKETEESITKAQFDKKEMKKENKTFTGLEKLQLDQLRLNKARDLAKANQEVKIKIGKHKKSHNRVKGLMSTDMLMDARGFDPTDLYDSDWETEPQLQAGGPEKKVSSPSPEKKSPMPKLGSVP